MDPRELHSDPRHLPSLLAVVNEKLYYNLLLLTTPRGPTFISYDLL